MENIVVQPPVTPLIDDIEQQNTPLYIRMHRLHNKFTQKDNYRQEIHQALGTNEDVIILSTLGGLGELIKQWHEEKKYLIAENARLQHYSATKTLAIKLLKTSIKRLRSSK
jgi:hypothetical protein